MVLSILLHGTVSRYHNFVKVKLCGQHCARNSRPHWSVQSPKLSASRSKWPVSAARTPFGWSNLVRAFVLEAHDPEQYFADKALCRRLEGGCLNDFDEFNEKIQPARLSGWGQGVGSPLVGAEPPFWGAFRSVTFGSQAAVVPSKGTATQRPLWLSCGSRVILIGAEPAVNAPDVCAYGLLITFVAKPRVDTDVVIEVSLLSKATPKPSLALQRSPTYASSLAGRRGQL